MRIVIGEQSVEVQSIVIRDLEIHVSLELTFPDGREGELYQTTEGTCCVKAGTESLIWGRENIQILP